MQQLELDLQKQRGLMVEREAAHEAHLIEMEKSEKQVRRADADVHNKKERVHEEEREVLSQAMADVAALGDVVNGMRDDVARLTQDNTAYAAEVAAYEEALSCRFELHSTLDHGKALETTLAALGEDLYEQLAQHSEMQRAMDATHRDAEAAGAAVAAMSEYMASALQPLADEANASNHEVPLLREELMQASLQRSETLQKLQMVQDAADEERRRHQREYAALSKKATQDEEQAAFTMDMQASQIEGMRRELGLCTEELENWRNGNIRLSNQKAWREERDKRITDDPSSIVAPAPPPAEASAPGASPAMRFKRGGRGAEAVDEESPAAA